VQNPAIPVVAIGPGAVTFCDQGLNLRQQRIEFEQRMPVRLDVAAIHTG